VNPVPETIGLEGVRTQLSIAFLCIYSSFLFVHQSIQKVPSSSISSWSASLLYLHSFSLLNDEYWACRTIYASKLKNATRSKDTSSSTRSVGALAAAWARSC